MYNSILVIRKYILPHEHLFCRFRTGDLNIALPAVRAELADLARLGVTDIVDLTAYTNPIRYVDFIADQPVRVHTNVGFYLEPYVRKAHRTLPVDDLVCVLERKRQRLERGGLAPSVIKVAARSGVQSPFEQRAFKAAAAFHRLTGLPIVTHSPAGFLEHQSLLLRHGVPADSIMLSHPEMAIKGRKALGPREVLDQMVKCVGRGSYLCITDLTAPGSVADRRRVAFINHLVRCGYADRIAVSGDSRWRVHRGRFAVQNSSRGKHGFSFAVQVADKLVRHGISTEIVQQISFSNPARFLKIDEQPLPDGRS